MANVLSAIVPKSLAKGLSDLVHGKPSFEVAKIRAKVLMIDRETESIAGKEAVDGAKALRLQGRGLEARVEALTGLAMLLLDLGFKKKKIRDLVTTGEIWYFADTERVLRTAVEQGRIEFEIVGELPDEAPEE